MDLFVSFSAPNPSEGPKSFLQPARKVGSSDAFRKSLDSSVQNGMQAKDSRDASTEPGLVAEKKGQNGMEAGKNKNTDVKAKVTEKKNDEGQTVRQEESAPKLEQETQLKDEELPTDEVVMPSMVALAVEQIALAGGATGGSNEIQAGANVVSPKIVAALAAQEVDPELLKLMEQKLVGMADQKPAEGSETKQQIEIGVKGQISTTTEGEAFAIEKLKEGKIFHELKVADSADVKTPKTEAELKNGKVFVDQDASSEALKTDSSKKSSGQQDANLSDHKGSKEEGLKLVDTVQSKEVEKPVAPRSFSEHLNVLSNERQGIAERGSVLAAKVSVSEFINMKNPFEQIAEKLDFKLTNGRHEVLMQLKPENLGQVRVMLQVHEGKLEGKFLAENQQVKQTLEGNMDQLKRQFEEQGLQVSKLSVSVGGSMDQQQWAGQSDDETQRMRNRNFMQDGIDGIDEADVVISKDRDDLHREAGGNVSYAI
jgi:flagellar hook-length control protein FliK